MYFRKNVKMSIIATAGILCDGPVAKKNLSLHIIYACVKLHNCIAKVTIHLHTYCTIGFVRIRRKLFEISYSHADKKPCAEIIDFPVHSIGKTLVAQTWIRFVFNLS